MAGDEKTTTSVPTPVTTSDIKGTTESGATPAAMPPDPIVGKRVGVVNGERNQMIALGAKSHYDGDRILEEDIGTDEFDRLLEDKGIYVEGTPRPKIKKFKPTKAGRPDDYEESDEDDDEDDDDDDDDDDEESDAEVPLKHHGREVIASGALARAARRGRT